MESRLAGQLYVLREERQLEQEALEQERRILLATVKAREEHCAAEQRACERRLVEVALARRREVIRHVALVRSWRTWAKWCSSRCKLEQMVTEFRALLGDYRRASRSLALWKARWNATTRRHAARHAADQIARAEYRAAQAVRRLAALEAQRAQWDIERGTLEHALATERKEHAHTQQALASQADAQRDREIGMRAAKDRRVMQLRQVLEEERKERKAALAAKDAEIHARQREHEAALARAEAIHEAALARRAAEGDAEGEQVASRREVAQAPTERVQGEALASQKAQLVALESALADKDREIARRTRGLLEKECMLRDQFCSHLHRAASRRRLFASLRCAWGRWTLRLQMRWCERACVLRRTAIEHSRRHSLFRALSSWCEEAGRRRQHRTPTQRVRSSPAAISRAGCRDHTCKPSSPETGMLHASRSRSRLGNGLR
jgi:hypothetical protein